MGPGVCAPPAPLPLPRAGFSPTFLPPSLADEMKRRRDFYAAYPMAEGEWQPGGAPPAPLGPRPRLSLPLLLPPSSQRLQRGSRGGLRAGQGEPGGRRDRQPVHRVLRRDEVTAAGAGGWLWDRGAAASTPCPTPCPVSPTGAVAVGSHPPSGARGCGIPGTRGGLQGGRGDGGSGSEGLGQ